MASQSIHKLMGMAVFRKSLLIRTNKLALSLLTTDLKAMRIYIMFSLVFVTSWMDDLFKLSLSIL